jgi:hypothetical protein
VTSVLPGRGHPPTYWESLLRCRCPARSGHPCLSLSRHRVSHVITWRAGQLFAHARTDQLEVYQLVLPGPSNRRVCGLTVQEPQPKVGGHVLCVCCASCGINRSWQHGHIEYLQTLGRYGICRCNGGFQRFLFRNNRYLGGHVLCVCCASCGINRSWQHGHIEYLNSLTDTR